MKTLLKILPWLVIVVAGFFAYKYFYTGKATVQTSIGGIDVEREGNTISVTVPASKKKKKKGFLVKAISSVKKVAKKVAPVASIISPRVGNALKIVGD